MINLDQVRTLEWKVKQAVQLIVHLRRENDTLRGRLSDTEVRLQEMETLLETIKASQTEMESGIRSALEELDHLEGADASAVVQADPLSYPPTPAPTPVRAAVVVPSPAPVAAAPVAVVAPQVEAPAADPVSDPVSDEEAEFAALLAEEAAQEAAAAARVAAELAAAEAAEAEAAAAQAVAEAAVEAVVATAATPEALDGASDDEDYTVEDETSGLFDDAVPESVELQEGLFDAPAPAAEDRKPEQAGLGIF